MSKMTSFPDFGLVGLILLTFSKIDAEFRNQMRDHIKYLSLDFGKVQQTLLQIVILNMPRFSKNEEYFKKFEFLSEILSFKKIKIVIFSISF